MLTSDTKKALRANAHIAVTKVAAQCGGEHVNKGAFCRLFMLPNIDAGIAGLVELERGWAGGKSNIDKIAKYQVLSFEKAVRLALNAQVHRHRASFQSVDEERFQYQGSAQLRATVPGLGRVTLISSLSGLPAHADERAGLFTIEMMGWTALHNILDVVTLTGNRTAYEALPR